jgi:hypothetical protein
MNNTYFNYTTETQEIPARQQFLLTFFNKKEIPQVKEVKNFILLKYFSNHTKRWEVQVFTKKSYKRYLEYIRETSLQSRAVTPKGKQTSH